MKILIMRNSILVFLIIQLHLNTVQGQLPVTNQKVIEFCSVNLHTQVGSGECWDLAEGALEYSKAQWETPYNFGEIVNNGTIIRGDIIQFEEVKIKGEHGSSSFPHHTAVVYEVLGKDKYLIVHQNFNDVRSVETFELNLADLKKGTITFYRPLAGN